MNLFLVRHGQSKANIDHSVYHSVPDSQIQLTLTGLYQARDAGVLLKELTGDQSEHTTILYSPWQRANSTARYIQNSLNVPLSQYIEEPLIVEEQVNPSYQAMQSTTREPYNSEVKEKFGRFWYKDGNEDSVFDCYRRARLFLSDLRSGYYPKTSNVVIVSHGMFLNMLIGAVDRLTVNEILDLPLIANCGIVERKL